MESKYKEQYKPLDLNAPKKSTYLGIDCPNCGTATPANNLNIQDKIAKCSSCNAVFSFEKEIVSLQTVSEKKIIKKPQGVDLLELKDELEISTYQPYSNLDIVVTTLFPLLVFIFGLLYFKKGDAWAIYPALGTLAAVVFSGIRLALNKRNRIYITVDKEHLNVFWRPNNFMKDKEYDVRDIEQIYVLPAADGPALYMIMNLPDGQKHQRLLGRFNNLTRAKYIEQELEKYLGIENYKVSGESL